MRKSLCTVVATVSLAACGSGDQSETQSRVASEPPAIGEIAMTDRPEVRWWLDNGFHTDETLRQSVQTLYNLGYGGMELLTLSNTSISKPIYGWGTEEWQHDMQVIVAAASELGMRVNFAAGPDWQPTFPYYGTNADVAKNRTWQDYFDDYDVLQRHGRRVLEELDGDPAFNVYETDDGVLSIDPNTDVFNQGLGLQSPTYVKAGETVEIDLTSFTYEAGPNEGRFNPLGPDGPPFVPPGGPGGPPPGGPGGPGGPDGPPPGAGGGKEVDRAKHTVDFANFETIALARAAAVGSKSLSLDGVSRFTDAQLTVGAADSLIHFDPADDTYTFRWTAPADDPEALYALTPAWRIGVGHGTGSNTNDYGYMLMVNHFNTAGADAIFAFWRRYILSDEVIELQSDTQWDWFLDSLEIMRLGNYYWSNEMRQVFRDLNGYDVAPYLPLLFADDFTIDGVDAAAVRSDMTNAMTQAYINFQKRLSENFASIGGQLRAQVAYGASLTTSSSIRAVDVPETESLAFKMSVEAMKLMSGGVHLAGANEFSSETTSWIGTRNASYVDQLYAVHQQMAAGVNRTVWHGYQADASSETKAGWPTTNVGIGQQFGSSNIPTSILEPDFNRHISLLQHILKLGTETVDVGIMQNDFYAIGLPTSGDEKGLLTQDHGLQNLGYTWEAFDSSYLWAEDGKYANQNPDGTLGHPMYKAIVVWDEDLSLAAARALLPLVRDGLRVVFLTDEAASATKSLVGDDAKLAAVVAEIKSERDQVRTVDSTQGIVTALQELGVTPRMALTSAVAAQPNRSLATHTARDGQDGYHSYDGLWTTMMRTEDANFYYVFNDSPDYEIATTASFEGLFTPFRIDTWSGEIEAVTDYRYVDGRTTLDLVLQPNDVAVYALGNTVSSGGSARAGSTVQVPEIDWNGQWHVTIEAWTRGDSFTRYEVRDNIDPYTGATFEVDGSTKHTTVEAGYATKKTTALDTEINNEDLVSWKEMHKTGISPKDLTAVSGVGTYGTAFVLPANWDTGAGILVDLGDVDGMIGMTVNDVKVPVNINNPVVDISQPLVAGENRMTVTVATSIANTVTNGAEMTARAFPDGGPRTGPDFYKTLPSAYGLTGPVSLTPYGKSVVSDAWSR